MTHVASHEGYAATTVAKVIAHAGVSRPTFYDYFANREDCFLAALAEIQEQALGSISRSIEGAAPERTVEAAITAMVAFADSHPLLARVLMVQSLTGGAAALDARDQTLEAIARPIEAALDELPAEALAPDLSARVLVGAVERLLSARLKTGKPLPSGLLDAILTGIRSYEQPVGEHRWRSLEPVDPPKPTQLTTRVAEPPPLPPGRSRLSKEDIEANHRQRILLAAARASVGKGYAATTAAEIAASAGVDGRVLHRLFRDKQALLTALFEMYFQHVMTVTAGAFFTAKDWPDRVWDAGRAFTQCLEQNPALTHVAFIETYVGGNATVRHAEGLLNAFTLFLRDGTGQALELSPSSRVTLDMISAAAFEIVYHQARASSTPALAGLLPHVTHLTLAPFLGSSAVNDFIAQKLSAEQSA